VFHLWLHFITFGGRSAHLAYHVHKGGRKTSIIIIIIIIFFPSEVTLQPYVLAITTSEGKQVTH